MCVRVCVCVCVCVEVGESIAALHVQTVQTGNVGQNVRCKQFQDFEKELEVAVETPLATKK